MQGIHSLGNGNGVNGMSSRANVLSTIELCVPQTTTLIILQRMLHQNVLFYTVEKPTATNTVGSYNESMFLSGIIDYEALQAIHVGLVVKSLLPCCPQEQFLYICVAWQQ